MNKIISVILLCTFLIFAFVGCVSDFENALDHSADGKHIHSFVWVVDLEPTSTTVGLKHKECANCGYRAEEEIEIPMKNIAEGSHALDEELINAMSEYLRDYRTEYDLPGWTLEEKLDLIKNQYNQSAFVKFGANCYYAAAYHASSHENPNEESNFYCCYNEYIWVRYENVEEIKNSHLGRNIVIAFQINAPEICKNMLNTDNKVYIEHFTIFKPEFESGIAVDPQVNFDNCFILVNNDNKKKVYYSSKWAGHEPWSIDCIEKDGEYYVSHYYSTTYDNRTHNVLDIPLFFGKYKDMLMTSVAEYFETYDNDRTYTFILFRLYDIENIVNGR